MAGDLGTHSNSLDSSRPSVYPSEWGQKLQLAPASRMPSSTLGVPKPPKPKVAIPHLPGTPHYSEQLLPSRLSAATRLARPVKGK